MPISDRAELLEFFEEHRLPAVIPSSETAHLCVVHEGGPFRCRFWIVLSCFRFGGAKIARGDMEFRGRVWGR